MKAIFAKLGVSSRPELTALLLDHLLTTTTARRGASERSSCRPQPTNSADANSRMSALSS
jgi:hypothetical protein